MGTGSSFEVKHLKSCGCSSDISDAPSKDRVPRTVAARRRWLEEQLDRTLTADTGASGRPATIAAAASSIIELLAGALKGDAVPPQTKLRGDLESLYQRSPRNRTIRGIMAATRDFGAYLVAAHAAGRIHQDLVPLAWSYAHMSCNRFGIDPTPEAILRCFMHRLYLDGGGIAERS